MSPFFLQWSKDDFHELGQLSGPLRDRIEQDNANVAEVCTYVSSRHKIQSICVGRVQRS